MLLDCYSGLCKYISGSTAYLLNCIMLKCLKKQQQKKPFKMVENETLQKAPLIQPTIQMFLLVYTLNYHFAFYVMFWSQ